LTMINSIERLLYIIMSEKSIVFESQFASFNIVFMSWLYEEFAKKSLSVCINGDSQILEFAWRLCGSNLVNNVCIPNANFEVAVILSNDAEKYFNTNAKTVIYILSRKASVRSMGMGQARYYEVRRVDDNVYTIVRRDHGRLMEYYVVKVSKCMLLDYQLPQEVVKICTILREMVEMSGGSVKAHDFLKHLVKVYKFNRENAMNAIRYAIQLNLIEYSNGYLTPK